MRTEAGGPWTRHLAWGQARPKRGPARLSHHLSGAGNLVAVTLGSTWAEVSVFQRQEKDRKRVSLSGVFTHLRIQAENSNSLPGSDYRLCLRASPPSSLICMFNRPFKLSISNPHLSPLPCLVPSALRQPTLGLPPPREILAGITSSGPGLVTKSELLSPLALLSSHCHSLKSGLSLLLGDSYERLPT